MRFLESTPLETGFEKTKRPRTGSSDQVRFFAPLLSEALFERIMVQAHRKGRTISEYVTAILDRQIPDYRTARPDPDNGERGGLSGSPTNQ